MYFVCVCHCLFFFFFKQKTAYEMRISDWSSDVCSSDLDVRHASWHRQIARQRMEARVRRQVVQRGQVARGGGDRPAVGEIALCQRTARSEEHTSELQSLMRISYAVFCLKKKTTTSLYRST